MLTFPVIRKKMYHFVRSFVLLDLKRPLIGKHSLTLCKLGHLLKSYVQKFQIHTTIILQVQLS